MLQGEKYQTILELSDGIKIQVNLRNWILLIPPRNYSYYPSLELLLVNLLDYKIKLFSINNVKKDLDSFRSSIQKSQEEIMAVCKAIMTVKI